MIMFEFMIQMVFKVDKFMFTIIHKAYLRLLLKII